MECKKIEKRFLIGVLLIIAFFPYLSQAAIPQKINYQGYLTGSAGVPVHGTVQMVFSIYDVVSGGTALWTENRDVTVTYGVYNVNLGEVTPVALAFDIPYYLGVRVGADPEMTPRIALSSVGYAYRAQTVESVSSHNHSGEDIIAGTVSEARIDGLIARDTEVSTAVNAHATRTDNPHATTAAQAGAVALNQASSITSSMIVNGTILFADINQNGCGTNQVMKWSGSAWVCAADATGVGDISAVYAGTGLTGGGTSGDVTLNVGVPLSLSGANAEGIISGTNTYTTGGHGVYGFASATTGSNSGVYGRTASSSGRGVYGYATAASGTTYGVRGDTTSTSGRGVYGLAGAATGETYGVHGHSNSSAGSGVYGSASAVGDVTNYGGYFTSAGNSGRGVIGVATATGEITNYGGYFTSDGGYGVGVSGSTSGSYGWGVYGDASGSSGRGVYGLASGSSGRGVYGHATLTGNVTNYGGYFTSDGDIGRGVYGYASGSYGRGVYGYASGSYGIGVRGYGGDYDFYAAGPGTNYGGFTGGHDVKLSSDFPTNILPGMIVSVTGESQVRSYGKGEISLSSTLPTVTISKKSQDKAVFGVFVKETALDRGGETHWYNKKEGERLGIVNALGEGRVWVSNINGDIEAGDYITTSVIPGYGQRQDDDLLHSYTLGKAVENVDWDLVTETIQFNGQTFKIYLIAVVYTSG